MGFDIAARGLERLTKRSATRGGGGGLFGPHLFFSLHHLCLVRFPDTDLNALWFFENIFLWILLRYATLRCALLCFATLRSYELQWPIRDCVIMLYVQV